MRPFRIFLFYLQFINAKQPAKIEQTISVFVCNHLLYPKSQHFVCFAFYPLLVGFISIIVSQLYLNPQILAIIRHNSTFSSFVVNT
ncbi:hypothetical protein [Escherichia coli]|uniref:pyroglutamyl-peptidase I family protein n=1 Tax=Escherichia coli TaxID=562 RepID=UPI0039C88CA4